MSLGTAARLRGGILAAALMALSTATYAQATLVTTADPAAPEDERVVPLCKTELRLSGAVYNAKRPERSFAIIELHPGQRGAMYREGMRVDRFEILQVEPRGVLLHDRDGECWVRLKGSPDRRMQLRPVSPKPKKALRAR